MNATQKRFLGVCAVIIISAGFIDHSAAQSKQRSLTGTSLSRFLAQTLELNPRMKAAKAALDAAKARLRAKKRFLYNPEVELEYQRNEDRERSARLSQTLDVWGRQRAQRTAAHAGVYAATAQVQVVEQEILAELLRALGKFQTQRQLNTLNLRKLRLSERLAKLAAQRRSAGDIDQSQLLVTRLNLVSAKLALSNSEAALLKAGADVSFITGEWRSKWPAVPAVRLFVERPDHKALDSLPIIRLARAKFDISKSQIAIAKRNRLPDPTIGLQVTKDKLETYAGISVSVPIPILNTFNAEVLAAASDAREQEFNANEIRRRARTRLLSSHAQLRNTALALSSWKRTGRNTLIQQNRLLERLLNVREINTVNYLLQLNQTFEAEAAALELRGNLWSAWVASLEASGKISRWVGRRK